MSSDDGSPLSVAVGLLLIAAIVAGFAVAAVRRLRSFRGRGDRPTSSRWYALSTGLLFAACAVLLAAGAAARIASAAAAGTLLALLLLAAAGLSGAVGRTAAAFETRDENRRRRGLGQPVRRFLMPPMALAGGWTVLAFGVGLVASILYYTAYPFRPADPAHPFQTPLTVTCLLPVVAGIVAAVVHYQVQQRRRFRDEQRVDQIDQLQQYALHHERDNDKRLVVAQVVPVGKRSEGSGTPHAYRRWTVRCSCGWSAAQTWPSTAGRWRPGPAADSGAEQAMQAHLDAHQAEAEGAQL